MGKKTVKRFVFSGRADAWSYTAVFYLSTVIPLIITLLASDVPMFLLVLCMSSFGILRDYLMLFNYERITQRVYIERTIGIALSSVTIVYSLGAMYSFFSIENCSWISTTNIIAATIFLWPSIVSGYEGILYEKSTAPNEVVPNDFVESGEDGPSDNRLNHTDIPVAQGTAVDA